MATLTLQGVDIRRGDRRVIHDVSFSAAAGELVAVMGPSGSGKSTILRAISGLDPIDAGTMDIEPPVLLMDEPTASLDPARRGKLAATLREIAHQGRTVLVATHDRDFARACARRVVVVEGG